MIELKEIKRVFKTGSLVQTALDGVDLKLRDNEFVAILGPSGSGKTTMLNIIGGLDRYDSGDLIINGVSTKDYKDRDWDTYRNHTIGFVFQSYNLIPHQTIVSNVELALTISGIGKAERRERALEALEKVGIKEHAYKKPNQLSGGQMQRVAIARALVNNPDVLLADEPTGALDTKSSVQVMDLLKEVAKDRLVVMVTHNPELAEQYATRIVKLRDGVITEDSDPVSESEALGAGVIAASEEEKTKTKKARMGFGTALSLSLNNLLTKKARTILTAFAGSIGIIGIALILSLSQGFQNYIDKIQEDTLTEYPLTITKETADTTSMILSMVEQRKEAEDKPTGTVTEHQFMTTMFSSIKANDMKTFKKYIEEHPDEMGTGVTRVKYTYSVSPLIYTIASDKKVTKLNPSDMLSGIYSSSVTGLMSSYSSMMGVFTEISDMKDIEEKYTVLQGRLPENYDEVILALPNKDSISDLLVYALGLKDPSEFQTMMADIMSGKPVESKSKPLSITYDELMELDFRLIDGTDLYKYNSKYDIYEDMTADETYMKKVYDNSVKLKVVGIVCSEEGNGGLGSGIMYTKALTDYVMSKSEESEIVKKQLADTKTDVFSGKPFDEKSDEPKLDFQDMISVDEEMIKSAFSSNVNPDSFKIDMMSEDEIQKIVMKEAEKYANQIAGGANVNTLTAAFTAINQGILKSTIDGYESKAAMSGYLSLAGVDMAANAITGSVYKQAIGTIMAMDPSASAMAGMLQLMTDEDYENFALSIRKALSAYYEPVKDPSYGYVETMGQIVPYSNESGNVTYGSALIPDGTGGFVPGNTTTQAELLQKAGLNEESLKASSTAINNIINNFTKYMIAAAIGEATGQIMKPLSESLGGLKDIFSGDLFTIDQEKFAQAFKFDMSQDELSRLMKTMLSSTGEKSAESNLVSLGYQDLEDPTTISFFFKDFAAKEEFVSFMDDYNERAGENGKIRYTDITGILMSSVKTIVDSVSYVLIAFVSVSLIVSSIMIAVITLISVMERTKEIGILRAMGASKNNVASIFNAETFIIGLLSGLIGIGTTFLLIIPINKLLYYLTENPDIKAYLPPVYAGILVIISVVLTVVAGLMPSRKASKNDPVVALRSE